MQQWSKTRIIEAEQTYKCKIFQIGKSPIITYQMHTRWWETTMRQRISSASTTKLTVIGKIKWVISTLWTIWAVLSIRCRSISLWISLIIIKIQSPMTMLSILWVLPLSKMDSILIISKMWALCKRKWYREKIYLLY